jgi:predicted ATP-dependent endonuclease of OLD family
VPKIRRISISNFRSIAELTLQATDLTVIVGDNDSGKSNVLRALNLFFNGQTNPGADFNFLLDYNRYAEPRAKKAPEISIELHLELPESYRENNGELIRWKKRWRADGLQDEGEYSGVRLEKRKRAAGFLEHQIELSGRSRAHSLLNKIQFEYVPAVRSADFFRHLRGRIFQVIAQASEQTVRESSGQFEVVIGEAVSGLLDDITLELQDRSKLRLPNDLTSIFESLDFLSGEHSISLDNRGDGIKARYIPLILKFIAQKSRQKPGIAPTFIWAYEEPENNLEFRRAQALADSFKKLAEDEFSQVLLTTHSPIFYNMHEYHAGNLCTAYHLTHTGTEEGTRACSATEAKVSLDQTMGAMAIIAPHIKAAQDSLAEATAQAADLKAKLEHHNQQNRPTLFVEGASDFSVFQHLLRRFRPGQAAQIFFAEPPPRAGANYVTNMLRSWEYRTRNLPTPRTRAVGLVDGDTEGLNAASRFAAEVGTWKHVSLRPHNAPTHLQNAATLGLEIGVCLEELWPLEVWQEADTRGWLTERSKSGLIGASLAQRLVDEDARLSDLIADEWRIFVDKRANESAGAKVAWAAHMIKMPDTRLEPLANSALIVLDRALSDLGV